MRKLIRAAVLAAAVAGVIPSMNAALAGEPAAAKVAGGAEVPVKQVVLFSSGVGYFEHGGNVAGNASTELRFKTQQINDILKSLVLQDMGGGKVGTVVYPSQDPLERTLKSFQVDITANPSLAELLNQLRGAKVSVSAGPEKLVGTILGTEVKPKAAGETVYEIKVLNLVAGGMIRSVALEDITQLQLEDPQLQEELNKALAALSQARGQDKKPVTINFTGQGERPVRIGYVVETPVWKTSYRLLLSGKGGDKSGLQGWAIVENQTDNDWNDVQLSLVSGRPISFIQELYQPLYVARPVVQPELFASLRPQTYGAGISDEQEKLALATEERAKDQRGVAGGAGRARQLSLGKAMGAVPAAAPREEMRKAGGVYVGEAAQLMDAAASVSSLAAGGKVGELFKYTVDNITLPRQKSAMIPIVSGPIEVEKLSVYNASVLASNPLNGARLKNTTDNHLLQGPVTVLEGSSYAGDARIENLPPGQERLLTYGIDLQMQVNSTKTRHDSTVQSGKIVKGVLQIQRKNVFTQEYVVTNRDTSDRTLIIEHPYRRDWKLAEPAKALETTETVYRFRTSVPGGKTGGLTVKEEQVQWETVEILPADFSAMQFYSRSAQISPKVREALVKAMTLKQRMAELQREVQQRKQQIDQFGKEQSRIRENLKAVPQNSALHTRLLEKMTEQEKTIDQLYSQMEEQQKAFEKARQELENYVSNLNLE